VERTYDGAEVASRRRRPKHNPLLKKEHLVSIPGTTEEKVAVITGASQGIGASLVAAYIKAGYKVVANSRSLGASSNRNIINVPGNIGDPATAERIMTEGVAKFGRLDTLVNNAGIFVSKPFTEYTQADYDAVLSTNLAGFFHITQRALRMMEAQGSGHMVNITAAIVDQPMNGVPAGLASLTKGGLNAITKSLAIEYAGRGIRVNAVAPGIIKTPMHPESTHAALASMHPLGRMGEIHDIVSAVMYLEHAEFVTGEISHVDGGQSAGHW
jgi:NAD(P)-dependent dehydrogenase (short-subunit alcohol dehydrogenase family)